MINSVGNEYTVWAQGLLRIPHKYSREQRKGPFHLLYSWSAWVLGCRRKTVEKEGYTNQAPRPPGWSPSCPLCSSCAGPLSFLVWAKLLPCICCSLSREDYFTSLYLRAPPYSSPTIPLPQGCLPWTPTVSLPTLSVVLFVTLSQSWFKSVLRNLKSFRHWSQVLLTLRPCLVLSTCCHLNASYSNWHMADT